MKANIDTQELDKFNKLAKQWWDPNGPMKPLHEINPLRLGYILHHTTLAQKNLIDVGCGAGLLAETLAKKGANVTAIDMASDVLNVAKQHATLTQLNIDYQPSTAENFASTHENCFDAVSCMELLEHVPKPDETIKACAKLAKPGGDVFFSTLNRNLKAYLKAIIGAEYLLKLLPIGTHEYAKFLKPSELDEMARRAGLVLVDVTGISYSPLTKQYKLTNDVSVNYLAYFKKGPK